MTCLCHIGCLPFDDSLGRNLLSLVSGLEDEAAECALGERIRIKGKVFVVAIVFIGRGLAVGVEGGKGDDGAGMGVSRHGGR